MNGQRNAVPCMARGIVMLLLCAVVLFAGRVEARECSSTYSLSRRFLNTTTQAGNPATCSDGSTPLYFINLPGQPFQPALDNNQPSKWIIYFGDGDTCDEEECDRLCDLSIEKEGGICEGIADDFSRLNETTIEVINCYLARLQCSSLTAQRTETVAAESILCRDKRAFRDFGRVFIPSCTLDWWLGRGSVSDPNSQRFRGAYVVDALFEALDAAHNIASSSLVVLAGSRGGGVGVLHSIQHIRAKLNNGPRVIGLIDSAWFIDTEGFSPKSDHPNDIFVVDYTLKKDTKDWIANGRLNEDCDTQWNVGGPGTAARHRCLIVPELLPFLSNEKLMFIHSEYDMFFLGTAGLLDETAEDRFFDAQSYALGAISYVESFGSTVRASTFAAASAPSQNHYFFMPSCGTHSFIIPTALHRFSEQTIPVASAGSIRIRRDIRTWENITVGNLTVEDAVGQWITGEGQYPILSSHPDVGDGTSVGLVSDKCKGFLCNPTCTESILPFRTASIFSPCAQNLVLVYVALVMLTLWIAFAWGYMKVKSFRRRARMYWKAFNSGMPLPDFGFSKSVSYAPRAIDLGGVDSTNNKPAIRVNQISPEAPPTSFTGRVSVALSRASVALSGPSFQPTEDESGDLFQRLAADLMSPDKNVRKAARKEFKEQSKRLAKEKKDASKSQAQREHDKRAREAKKQYDERQAALGLQAQQKKAEEDAKKAKKNKGKAATGNQVVDDVSDVVNPVFQGAAVSTSAPANIVDNSGKIQAKAQDELLEEASSQDYRRVHLMVRDLSYWAPPRKAPSTLKKLFRPEAASQGRYQILRNVDLGVEPGQVHALMGPSGSGKSTLLDVLALIRDSGEMQGTHYINGVPSHTKQAVFLRDWLRNNVSYVRQTDVLFPRMTVREHLQHAAWLLLPQFMPDHKKLRRVQQVIEILELDATSDTICGDGGVKIEGGLSGGQRRRVSVATQLLRLPVCLILDEPTSGLDSTNALLLCKSLNTLAKKGGLTVVLTIHQPRNEIFDLFDQMTILVGGKIVFSGIPKLAAEHFKISKKELQLSISDAILDKLALASDEEVTQYAQEYDRVLGKQVLRRMEQEITPFDEDFAQTLQVTLRENAMGEGRWSWEAPTSASMQMWVLLSRTMRRGGFDLRKSISLAILGGCIVGICFLQTNSVTSRVALCYLCVATMTFLQGAFLGDRYLAEKQMYDHESAAGSAVHWTAFLASQFVRDSVTSASEAIAFGIPVYWIGGMYPAGERFAIYLILIILMAHVCISSNVLVEIDRDNLRAAALVNVSYVGLGALFNGFIIQIRDLPVYLSWLPYIMVTYWGFAGILVNDFTGDLFGCEASVLECATRTGDVVIVQFSFDSVDSYVSMTVLLAMAILFRTCAVMDFFLRYVRGKGSGLKLIGGTAFAEKQQGSKAMGSAMAAMMSRSGNAGAKMLERIRQENQAITERIQKIRQDGIAFDNNQEWDQVAEQKLEEANKFDIAPKLPLYQELLLSRPLLVAIGIIDVGFLALVCALSVDNSELYHFFLAMNAIGALFFLVQFIVSLCTMVPITPDGPKDCTWSGETDILAFICTVADVVLLVQLWTSNSYSPTTDPVTQANNATTFLILSGATRAVRIARVGLFWYKVARFHEVRALTWLMATQEDRAAAQAGEGNQSARNSARHSAGLSNRNSRNLSAQAMSNELKFRQSYRISSHHLVDSIAPKLPDL